MYSILLAEDESLIRSNIIHQINNYMDGYSVMMTASAGDEAIRMLSNTEPDIILTDIRMPGADGLQVIRYAKERYGDIPCIVLTGFQDFDIVKEALQLGAIGYLLKPVQTGELIESLQRAAQMIKKKNMYDSLYPVVELEPYFIQAMNGDVSDVDAFVDKAKKCMPIMPDGDPKVVLAIDDYVMRNELIDLLNMKKSVVFSSRYLVYAVIIHIPKQWSQQRIQEEIRNLSKQLEHPKPPAIGISRPFHGWEEALDRFEEAFQYYSYRFYIGSPWVAGPLEASAARPHLRHAEAAAVARKAADRLELSNQLDRWHAIEEELHTWFGILKVEQWPVRVVHQECGRIIRKFLSTFTDDQLDLLGLKNWSATQWVVKKRTLKELQSDMIHFLRDIKSKTEHYSGHAQSIVARVQAIIERDYSNSALSIVQIAEQLYISTSHLSTVFKKKTGKPFSQYLKEIRLKKASELMKEDRLKIYEIAASVGYLNEKSFSRAFRRELGVSPQNYKRESGLL